MPVNDDEVPENWEPRRLKLPPGPAQRRDRKKAYRCRRGCGRVVQFNNSTCSVCQTVGITIVPLKKPAWKAKRTE